MQGCGSAQGLKSPGILETMSDDESAPIPGNAVRGSETGRPIMAAFDLLGRRWMLRILWELRFGAVRFSDLRRRIPEASPTTMSQRLDELVDARIVTKGRSGYRLTTHGAALLVSLGPLELWAKSWKLAHRD